MDLCPTCGAYWFNCGHRDGLEDSSLVAITDAEAWGNAELGRQRDREAWEAERQREHWRAEQPLSGMTRHDLPTTATAEDWIVLADALAAGAGGRMESITRFGELLLDALRPATEQMVRTLTEPNPPPVNRAGRRRRHAEPARPGWMAIRPPSDPARFSRR